MRLVADRFAIIDDHRVLDLATGERVALTITKSAAPSEQRRWAVRCDGLHKLHHRSLAWLLDYGTIGESQRFEAWDCGPRWIGARSERDRTREVAARFLRSCGLTAGAESATAVHHSGRGAVLLPDECSGYPNANLRTIESVSLEVCGLATLDRRPLAVVTELLQLTSDVRPRVVGLFGPAGSGKTMVLREIARCARLNGFVPIAARLAPLLAEDEGRCLCFIHDDSEGDEWSRLVEAAIRTPRPHVLIVAARDEIPSVDGINLDRISSESLLAAIRPLSLSPRLWRTLRSAAVRAQGLPGKFVHILWKGSGGSRQRAAHTLPHVAEEAAIYALDEPPAVGPTAAGSTAAAADRWPCPGELKALKRRVGEGRDLLAAGRHAAGVRKLRQAIAGLARRDDWVHATDGAIALASFLLTRGQAQRAQAVINEANGYCARSKQEGSLLTLATLSGEAWTDMARLDEAESVLGAAIAGARSAGDGMRAGHASIALARVLFWRGCYQDAELTIARVDHGSLSSDARLKSTLLAARIAVGRRDFTRAMAAATEGVEQVRAGDDRAQAEAACTGAFIHLAVGDLDAVTRDAAASIAAARRAHDPLRAIRARLLLAEADRRRQRRSSVSAIIARLKRIGGAQLPSLVRARCDLLHELVSSETPAREIVSRRVAATGLEALRLYLPDGATPRPQLFAWESLTDDVVDILSVCQEAQDEIAALGDVCSKLRRQLHAASVACMVPEQASYAVLAASGGGAQATIAARVVNAGMAIAPHRYEDRLEAAAPVRHGGAVIGVLAARWTLGSSYDLSRAPAVLAMAAAAAGPVVSAARARRSPEPIAALDDLLGVAPAMVDLRRHVERAAAAPFPVLVEGESGAGKELVARAVHRSGPRRARAFCTLNCAALPDDLVEAELFGHVRGAFTGAIAERAGVFEEAHGGTLFLDEIGELSARAQAKVLRVIQEGELRRVGDNVSRHVDVRIVAATNRDLRRDASAGRFRLDLLYRLDVIRISVPSLRERREDIALLVDHFWSQAVGRLGSRATLSVATIVALARYDWPGNVRELQNVLAALAVRCAKRGVVPPHALPSQVVGSAQSHPSELEAARRTFDERFVRAALVRTGGHRGRAATELGVSRQGLTKLMARLGIQA